MYFSDCIFSENLLVLEPMQRTQNSHLVTGWMNHGRGHSFVSYSAGLAWPSVPSNLILNGYSALFPRGQSERFVTLLIRLLLQLRLNRSGTNFYSPYMTSQSIQGQLNSIFIIWVLSSFSFCYIANTNLVAIASCCFIMTVSTFGRTSVVNGECSAEGV